MNINELSYRKAVLSDYDDFYTIKADKNNIEWGGFEKAPDYNSFYKWFEAQLASTTRTIYLVFYYNKCIAFFYVDKIDDDTYEAASSGVLSEYTGCGVGTYTLRESVCVCKNLGAKHIFSWVAEDNIASYKRYERLGFVRTQEKEVRHLPLLGGEHTFYKWILDL